MSDNTALSGQSGDQEMLSDIIYIWFDYIENRLAKNTVILYKLALKQFLRTLPKKTPKNSITPFHIEKYINYLLKTKHKNQTTNVYLAAVKSFFRWTANYYQIDNPAKCITELIEEPPKFRCLSEIEYQKVLNATRGIENAALQFLGNTGLRRDEFRFLAYSNLTSDFIQIRGKGQKTRSIPLNDICKQLLSKYPQNGNIKPPFVQRFQYRESLYRLGRRLAEQLDIEPFGPHAFRHFFATRLIRAGVPLIKVSIILGHSNITITQKTYLHLIPQDLLGVTDCLEL